MNAGRMSASELGEIIRENKRERRRIGIRGDGRYCLACHEPLFGPDLLHARSLAGRPSNLMDAIRYAGTQPEHHV